MNSEKKGPVAKRSDTVGLKSITIPCPVDPEKYFGCTLWEQVKNLSQNEHAIEWIDWWAKPKDLKDAVLIFPQLLREGVSETQVDGVPCLSVPIQKGDWLSKLFGSDWRNIYYHSINKNKFRKEFSKPDHIDVQFKDGQQAVIYVPLKRTLPELPESAEGDVCREVELQVPTVHQGCTGQKKIIRVQPTIDEIKPKQTRSPTKSVSSDPISVPVKLKGPCSQFKAKAELKVSGTRHGNKLTFETSGKSATAKLATDEGKEIAIQLDKNGVSISSSTSTKLIQFGSFIFTVEWKNESTHSDIKFLLILKGEKTWQDNEKGLSIKLSLTLEIEMLSAESLVQLKKCGFRMSKAPELVPEPVVDNYQRLLEELAKNAKELGEQIEPWIIPISILGIVILLVSIYLSPLAALLGTLATSLIPAAAFSEEDKKADKKRAMQVPLCVVLKDSHLPPELTKNTITVSPDKLNICLKYED